MTTGGSEQCAQKQITTMLQKAQNYPEIIWAINPYFFREHDITTNIIGTHIIYRLNNVFRKIIFFVKQILENIKK